MKQPHRRSSVGQISADISPAEHKSESELRSYAYMGLRDHRPSYGTGHAPVYNATMDEWRESARFTILIGSMGRFKRRKQPITGMAQAEIFRQPGSDKRPDRATT